METDALEGTSEEVNSNDNPTVDIIGITNSGPSTLLYLE